MENKDAYDNLLEKIMEIKKISNEEKEICRSGLKSKKESIINLRAIVDEELNNKYTSIAYFFPLYLIILKNHINSDDFNNFKKGLMENEILSIIKNKLIDGNYVDSSKADEYKEVYKSLVENYIKLGDIPNYLDRFSRNLWEIIEKD